MVISIASRKMYHPHLTEDGVFQGGERDYEGRLRKIEQVIDFNGARVLDLGCSGGFFSFSLAKKAAFVCAVDADEELQNQNRITKGRLGLNNIEFLTATLTPSFLKSLPQFDVVLFLSVFHHFFATSGTYDWCDSDSSSAYEVLEAIKAIGNVLVFETGHPDEGFEWCQDIQQTSGELREWVRQTVFGDSYARVLTLRGTAYDHFPFKIMPFLRRLIPANKYGRKAIKMLGLDVRDFRDIHIGFRF